VALAGPAVQAKPRLTPQEQLDKALAGREAGKPVDCIYMPTVSRSQIFEGIGILYDAGSTLYLQKPRLGADQLRSDDILVTRLTSAQLCSVDTIQLRDRTSGFWRGFVGLDKFVPYTRPPRTRLPLRWRPSLRAELAGVGAIWSRGRAGAMRAP
jgi:hypothetical protein